MLQRLGDNHYRDETQKPVKAGEIVTIYNGVFGTDKSKVRVFTATEPNPDGWITFTYEFIKSN